MGDIHFISILGVDLTFSSSYYKLPDCQTVVILSVLGSFGSPKLPPHELVPRPVLKAPEWAPARARC